MARVSVRLPVGQTPALSKTTQARIKKSTPSAPCRAVLPGL